MVPKSDNLTLSYGGITVGGVSYESRDFAESGIGRIREIENNKNLGAVVPKVLGSTEVNGRKVLLMGTNFNDELSLKTWWQFQGRVPGESELMVGSAAAATLGLKVGDQLAMAGHDFRVAAILLATGGAEDGVIIANMAEAQKVLGKEGRVSMVEISAFCRGCPISDMVLQIAEKFPEAKVTALKQAVMSKMQSIELFKSFSYGIAVLVVFIGSLLVFITMMGSVNERTREIGIFRAIGFRRGHVMRIILLEAMVVGLIGGLFGVIGGNGVAWLVMPMVIKGGVFAGINMNLGGIAILLAVALSLLASLYPALKASRLDPSEALRAL
jgi:putative ABC transport system permease protein